MKSYLGNLQKLVKSSSSRKLRRDRLVGSLNSCDKIGTLINPLLGWVLVCFKLIFFLEAS